MSIRSIEQFSANSTLSSLSCVSPRGTVRGRTTNSQPAMFLSRILQRLGAVALLGLAALPSLSSAAYAEPGACSGYCWTHDPAVVKRASDGTYFRFATGGGVQVAKATSLSGSWTFVGEALPGGSSIALAGNTDLWVSILLRPPPPIGLNNKIHSTQMY